MQILTCDLWTMINTIHQHDTVPIRIQWKKVQKTCLRRIFSNKFCQPRIFSTKNHACSAFFSIKKSCLWGIRDQFLVWFTNSLVLKMIRIQILSDHKDKNCPKNSWRNDKPFQAVETNLMRLKPHNTNSIPKPWQFIRNKVHHHK